MSAASDLLQPEHTSVRDPLGPTAFWSRYVSAAGDLLQIGYFQHLEYCIFFRQNYRYFFFNTLAKQRPCHR